MPGDPLRPDQERDALIAAARAEDLDVDLSAAVFQVGWENVVLNTSDGWILRFPREGGREYRRELAVLETLHGRLPAPIPQVRFTGRLREFAGYRRLDGVHLDVGQYERAATAERDRVAASMARFLAAMHDAFSAAEIADLEIPGFADEEFYPSAEPALARELQPRLDALKEQERALHASGSNGAVLLHNDFHVGNMVLDAPLGDLAGVWDFSCVATGDPSLEFRYLVGDSTDLAQRVASFYAARTGREIDLGLAAVALRLEEVSDAITEGRDPAPYL